MKKADTPAKTCMVCLTGLLAALLAALWIRPYGSAPSLGKAVAIAAIWMAVTALGGALGLFAAASFVDGRPAWPGARLAAGVAVAWVLIPPMLLLGWRGSAGSAVVAASAAAAVAGVLWGNTRGAAAREERESWQEGPLFADLPAPDSGRPLALLIAVCAELAAVLARRDAIFGAAVLMGIAGFGYAWKRLASLERKPADSLGGSVARAGIAAAVALLILIPLLLLRLARTRGGAVATAQAATRTEADRDAANGYSDPYRGIVLFTVQDKTKQLPPVPIDRDLLRTGRAKPLVIPFDGSYWYYQAPQHGPGLHPHLVHGDPVKASIFSTNWVPLAMQAHQTLAQPVDLRSCGALRVTLRNGDNRRGRIDLGVLLTDSTLPGKPSMDLGTQPIVSTEDEHFSLKVNPVSDELSFTMPQRRTISKFDEITVLFYPNSERVTLGARVGIRQFELVPR